MLARWMLQQSKNGKLDVVAAIIKGSKPSLKQERVITSDEALLNIALQCIYSCPAASDATWKAMTEIYEVR